MLAPATRSGRRAKPTRRGVHDDSIILKPPGIAVHDGAARLERARVRLRAEEDDQEECRSIALRG